MHGLAVKSKAMDKLLKTKDCLTLKISIFWCTHLCWIIFLTTLLENSREISIVVAHTDTVLM